MSGAGGGFPQTHHSAVQRLKDADESTRRRAFEVVAGVYWKPVYKYVRLKWGRTAEDAEDFTQGFFARAAEKDFLADYDASKAKFRTFLRICLDRYVQKELEAEQREKRGGGATVLSYEFARAEQELALTGALTTDSVEEIFEKEWIRSLFESSLAALERELTAAGKQRHFYVFRRYDVERDESGSTLTYESLATETNLSVTDVTNYLSETRRMFRRIVLDQLREQTASEDEYRDEVRALLGIKLR
jgi:hypothetical protein